MIYELDPLRDPRWHEVVKQHPSASLFHTPGWLKALQQTYGCTPSVLTTSPPDQPLTNGLVFCRVESWLTGRRLISLPFTDYCEPLSATGDDILPLVAGLQELSSAGLYQYTELRPLTPFPAPPPNFEISQSFYHHQVDLHPGADAVYKCFHKDCIRRKIRRADKEGLVLTEGHTPDDLRHFHHLLLQTRRRHGLPPQPLAWFRNLADCLDTAATIRMARKNGQPIAGIFTATHANTLYYKYGASDAAFHRLGAMPFLFWHAIQDAIRGGLEVLDLGRTDCDNLGLIKFKEHWGATRATVSYWRTPAQMPQPVTGKTWKSRIMRSLCTHLPDRALTALGALLYRHVA